MRFIKHPITRYLIWGLANTGLTYLIYLLSLQVFPYLVAYTISYISGIVLSYFFNSILVFKVSLHWKKALKYPLVYLIQYLLGSVLITILVEYFGIAPSIAALLNVIVLLPVSFILTRLILKDKPEPQNQG